MFYEQIKNKGADGKEKFEAQEFSLPLLSEENLIIIIKKSDYGRRN